MKGARVTGIDIDPQAMEYARRVASALKILSAGSNYMWKVPTSYKKMYIKYASPTTLRPSIQRRRTTNIFHKMRKDSSYLMR